MTRRIPPHCYGWWPELELIEVGRRAAFAYDEPHEVAYRIGAALGMARAVVPLSWQRSFVLLPRP